LGKVMPMAFAFLATRSARSIVFGVDMSRSFLIAVTMLAALVAPAAGAEVPNQGQSPVRRPHLATSVP